MSKRPTIGEQIRALRKAGLHGQSVATGQKVLRVIDKETKPAKPAPMVNTGEGEVVANLNQITAMLEATLAACRARYDQAPLDDGKIRDDRLHNDPFTLARSTPRDLDGLERWARQQQQIGKNLQDSHVFSGGDQRASALGLSKQSQRRADELAKSQSESVRSDSWTGSYRNLAPFPNKKK